MSDYRIGKAVCYDWVAYWDGFFADCNRTGTNPIERMRLYRVRFQESHKCPDPPYRELTSGARVVETMRLASKLNLADLALIVSHCLDGERETNAHKPVFKRVGRYMGQGDGPRFHRNSVY